MSYRDVLDQLDTLSSDICNIRNASDEVHIHSRDWFLKCMLSYVKKNMIEIVDKMDSDFFENIELDVIQDYHQTKLNQATAEKILISI